MLSSNRVGLAYRGVLHRLGRCNRYASAGPSYVEACTNNMSALLYAVQLRGSRPGAAVYSHSDPARKELHITLHGSRGAIIEAIRASYV